MTGFDSKRQMAQAKLDDDDDTQVYAETLLIVYQRGFADGKKAARPEQEPDRRALQAAGTHPAPCARHCEAKAFEIEIRSLKSALKQQPEQEQALKKLADLGQEIEQEPTCPECKAVVLYECVACSSNNYPPRPEQGPVAFINPPGPITQYRIPTQTLPDEIVRLAGVALHEMPRPRTDWHSCAKLVCEAVVAHGKKEGT